MVGPLPDVHHRMPGPGAAVSAAPRGVAYIALEGDLDVCSEARLRQRLTSVLDAGTACLVLDLRDVAFLDCAGLRALLLARRLVEARGGRLLLTRVPDHVRRVIALTGTGTLLEDRPFRRGPVPQPRAV
jgi:anti-sigma B factor antagonist